MLKALNISVTIAVVFLMDLICFSGAVLASEIKWFINSDVIGTFWVSEDKLIGISQAGKFTVVDTKGQVIWQMEVDKKQGYLTKHLRRISPDGRLSALSPDDGTKVWEKDLASQNIFTAEGNDGTIAAVFANENEAGAEVNVFSKDGNLLWRQAGLDLTFNPIGVLPAGKAVIGVVTNEARQEEEIRIIEPLGKQRTIASLKDPYLLSAESWPVVITNETTKQTLVVVPTTPWWAIISSTGEVVANEMHSPVKNPIVASLGSGFVFGAEGGNRVALLSEKGKVMWLKDMDAPVWGLTGNSAHLVIMTGRPGTKGKISLYNPEGKIEDYIFVTTTPTQIQIAKTVPLVVGYLDYSKVFLYDFSK